MELVKSYTYCIIDIYSEIHVIVFVFLFTNSDVRCLFDFILFPNIQEQIVFNDVTFI